MKKLLTFVIALFYVITLLLPSVAFAGQTKTMSTTPNSIILFQEDQKFSLPNNEVSYWFTIPKGTELGDCNLNLDLTYSGTLIDNHTNLSVLINDSPVDTKWLNDLKMTTSWWKVTIPATLLKVDAINEIKIQSNQRSILGDCADIDNTSNWMVIHKDTFMDVTMKKYPDVLLSNFFPIYGDNLLNKYAISDDFVLPKKADNNSISSLLKLSSALGAIDKDKNDLNYKVSLGSSDDQSFKNKIFLGPISEWSNSSQLSLPGQELGQAQGFISMRGQAGQGAMTMPTTANDITLFNTLITGNNQAGMNKAVNFLASQQLMNQVKKNSLVINSDIDLQRTPFVVKEDGLYNFSDFGYGNINLAGAFHQKTYLTFVQPRGIQSANGSYLNIKFNHSKILVSDRSIMTVYINGIATNSEKLSAANAEEGTLKVIIPAAALKANVINVGIECYNYLGVIDCSKNYDESAWTAISSDSEICLLPGNSVLQPDLTLFPYFYTKQNKDVPHVVLGSPDYLNTSMLETASLIATRAGQNTGETLNWDTINSNKELTSEQKGLDMVYLGSYTNINLPQNIKNQLFVVPSGDGTFSIKPGLQIEPETLQDKVLFQVVRSPWDATKRLYVVMYDKDNNLQILKKVLSEGDLLNKMTGQIAVVDSDSEIHNFTYDENVIVGPPKTLKDRIQAIEKITHFPWWLLLIFIIAIRLGIIALIRLKESKNEFENIGKKMKDQEGFTDDEQ
ncbi:MAG: cellulose biosynthesis cyclic di-GMP-binding regulatory protein BcsB [Desulfosporosinus sp.]|nr:cellulose biosynthesis cyclic di-GMP-binding regulatory protein BcsB [Desulfosporosinus sp.]